jgi:hypothetical protein
MVQVGLVGDVHVDAALVLHPDANHGDHHGGKDTQER